MSACPPLQPAAVIVDSIQTVYLDEVSSSAGSVTQVGCGGEPRPGLAGANLDGAGRREGLVGGSLTQPGCCGAAVLCGGCASILPLLPTHGLLPWQCAHTQAQPFSPPAPCPAPQVRECATALLQVAKRERIPVFLVGHVTKSGDLAGEHTPASRPALLHPCMELVAQQEAGEHDGRPRSRLLADRGEELHEPAPVLTADPMTAPGTPCTPICCPGPRVLEHIVDTVVYMEGGRQQPVRLVSHRRRAQPAESERRGAGSMACMSCHVGACRRPATGPHALELAKVLNMGWPCHQSILGNSAGSEACGPAAGLASSTLRPH